MTGKVAALYRHPVKGFTPERLGSATLEARAHFPGDRLYAVENGPSGYDPQNPVHIPKSKFAVLAQIPALARVRTAYDEQTGVLTVEANGLAPLQAKLTEPAGREAFAAWLETFIDPEHRRGPLRVLPSSGPRRFTDSPVGFVSLVNLESVRDLEARIGRRIDPLRFRANVYVEGWPAWSESTTAQGSAIRLGKAEFRVVKAIARCAATHVNTEAGERDLEIVGELMKNYGHVHCGLYLETVWGGRVAEAAAAELAPAPHPAAAGPETRLELIYPPA